MLKKIGTVLGSETIGVLVRMRCCLHAPFSHGEDLECVNVAARKER